MKRTLTGILAFFFLTASAWAWKARVIEIKDGDSILVRVDGEARSVELYGLDAPEMGQPYGREARKYTAALLSTENVDIETVKEDEDGKVYGMVHMIFKAGRFANEEIVQGGFARVDEENCDLPVCEDWKRYQGEAQEARRGMWKDWRPLPSWKKK